DLTALLYYAAGVTKKKTYAGGGEVLFRAAPSTGALYQTEAYVAVGRVDGLEPGLYHFCPGDFALRCLRAGDVRAFLAHAVADETIARRAATVLLTAIYWRNTWKYQARGYRHLFWDSGTLLAHLLEVGSALGLAPRLYAGFVALPAPREASGRVLGETIQQRGSTRQFSHASLSAAELATALWAATRPIDADVPAGLVDLYLIVNAVDGVTSGAYWYRPEAHALELLAAGHYRNESAYLCLEQPLGGDAAAVLYFLAPLARILP